MKKIKFNQNIKFKCQGSSNCCISRGSYGYVYLSSKDVSRFSTYHKITNSEFIKKFCEYTDGYLHLKEKNLDGKCIFLNKKKCTVYSARPTQCRTWPFWKENLNYKKWNDEITKFCPGIGKGNIVSQKKIIELSNLDLKNEKIIMKKR